MFLDTSILPAGQQLALAYAGQGRAVIGAGLLLDTRLGMSLRGASEPIVAQLKLAWWRDRFAEDPAAWPTGEPLLGALQGWRTSLNGLGSLIDGWEVLTSERLDTEAVTRFWRGRMELWRIMAAELGTAYRAQALEDAVRFWALGDLAAHVRDDAERATIKAMARPASPLPALPRRLRPLLVLSALGRRGLVRGGAPLVDGIGTLPLALRVGIIGR